MTAYRRCYISGATYFFTVVLADRSQTLLVDHIAELRTAICQVKTAHPFAIVAMVVLPEHLHAIWTMPEHDADFSTRWRQIKSGFSRALPANESISNSRKIKNERGIWQRRFWEHAVRDETDLRRCADYVHYNPVKHGLVDRAEDWPYSTLSRYLNNAP